jgi:hypothetical protein
MPRHHYPSRLWTSTGSSQSMMVSAILPETMSYEISPILPIRQPDVRTLSGGWWGRIFGGHAGHHDRGSKGCPGETEAGSRGAEGSGNGGRGVRYTLSAGIPQVPLADSVDNPFGRAGSALYRSKNLGRNCVSVRGSDDA